MLQSLKNSFLHGKKQILNTAFDIFNPCKKVIQFLSPLTAFIFALLLSYLSITIDAGYYTKIFSFVFVVFAFLNGIYNMFFQKKYYNLIREYMLNIFYFISCIIFAKYLLENNLKQIFENPGIFFASLKRSITQNDSFIGKIMAFVNLISFLVSSIGLIYNSITKYLSNPKYQKIDIYQSRNGQIVRRNNEYESIDSMKYFIAPIINCIICFFTFKNPFVYILSLANLLSVFQVSTEEKYFTQLMPLVITIIWTLINLSKFYSKIVNAHLNSSM